MSLYSVSQPQPQQSSKPSPRRQPIVPQRKPVDPYALLRQYRETAVGNVPSDSSPWRTIGAQQWAAVSFTDIPPAAYDRVLEEVLKGMLYETTRAAEEELGRIATASNTASIAGSRNGVSFAEPAPLIAGPTSAASLLAPALAPAVPSMYARMTRAYNSVMAMFGASEPERDQAATSLETTQRLTASDISPASVTMPSFAATLGSLCDRRVKQCERMLKAARGESEELSMQLDDLRAAHEQVHQDLNRSYREYDKVQRQLLEALEREKAARGTSSNVAQRQDERWKVKALGGLPGGDMTVQ
jgi:hypothetical protein